jgi:hypothetical protein
MGNLKYRIVLICMFVFLFKMYSENVVFEGYYVEVLSISRKHKLLSGGEYLVDSDSLKVLLENPKNVWSDKNIKRLFNYTSYFFKLAQGYPKPIWVTDLKQIDWNLKVSLHRANDYTCHKLYVSLIDNSYAFYIKKIIIEIEPLGNVKEMTEKGYHLNFRSAGGGVNIHNISNENFLLRKIINQTLFSEEDMKKEGFEKYIKPMDIVDANNTFHPRFNFTRDKRSWKKIKYKCQCENSFPSSY